MNYLLGREAQDVLMAASSLDHFLVPGSQFASEIARLEAAGTRITNVGVEFVQRNDRKRNHEISTQLQQILRDKP